MLPKFGFALLLVSTIVGFLDGRFHFVESDDGNIIHSKIEQESTVLGQDSGNCSHYFLPISKKIYIGALR